MTQRLDESDNCIYDDLEELREENARLRNALEAVEKWMASEEGPLETMWDDGYIGSYEDYDMSWELTLDQVRKLDIDPVMLGVLGDSETVRVYRAVLAALSPRGEGDLAVCQCGHYALIHSGRCMADACDCKDFANKQRGEGEE